MSGFLDGEFTVTMSQAAGKRNMTGADLAAIAGVGAALLLSWAWYLTHPPTSIVESGDQSTNGIHESAAVERFLVDINTADAATLDLIPGFGPALAGRIIDRRERVGSFRNLDQLTRVRGIGLGVLDRARPWLVCRINDHHTGTDRLAHQTVSLVGSK